MQVEIATKYDNRKVGTIIDLDDSVANQLLKKGLVKLPNSVEQQNKEEKKTIKKK